MQLQNIKEQVAGVRHKNESHVDRRWMPFHHAKLLSRPAPEVRSGAGHSLCLSLDLHLLGQRVLGTAMPMMRAKPMVLDDSVEEGSPTTASKEFQAPRMMLGWPLMLIDVQLLFNPPRGGGHGSQCGRGR